MNELAADEADKNRIERVERRNQEGEGIYNSEDKGRDTITREHKLIVMTNTA